MQDIRELLDEARIERKQSALKELIYRRDGYHCLVTQMPFRGPGGTVIARCAHILPFSFRDKSITLRTIEIFTGGAITAENVGESINLPSNAFNVQSDAHDSFNKLGWGIEAIQGPGEQWNFFFRELHSAAYTIFLKDGDEIQFRKGDNHEMIDPPNPWFCNLRLALSRVMYACGASKIIASMYGDDDDDAMVNQPIYFGGPFKYL